MSRETSGMTARWLDSWYTLGQAETDIVKAWPNLRCFRCGQGGNACAWEETCVYYWLACLSQSIYKYTCAMAKLEHIKQQGTDDSVTWRDAFDFCATNLAEKGSHAEVRTSFVKYCKSVFALERDKYLWPDLLCEAWPQTHFWQKRYTKSRAVFCCILVAELCFGEKACTNASVSLLCGAR